VIKRTIEISQESLHLAVELDQLRLYRREPEGGLVSSIPCEDIGLVVVDHPAATYSHAALARLVDFGAAVLICGKNHLPAGMLLPLSNHTEVVWRIQEQIAAGKPLRKQLWKQIIAAKVRNQANNFPAHSPIHRRLGALATAVKSGDPTNIEAQAAKVYWSEWLGTPHPNPPPQGGREPEGSLLEGARETEGEGLEPEMALFDRPGVSEQSGEKDGQVALLAENGSAGYAGVPASPSHEDGARFHRDPDGKDPINGMLNYGYAIVRAAIGRALVSAGLVPALGIHHANRSNAFCLADDLLEPLRPLVDRAVRELHRAGQKEINRQTKAKLLELLTTTVRVEDQTGPLMVALHRTVASLVACYEGQARSLALPEWPMVNSEL
jgi:CRISPR/Cas system-associated endonuclease Cas1